MKRLILDHFRRWGWILALGAVFAFAQGWFIASSPAFTFEFWVLLLAMWTGANLLSFDLQRGFARTVAALPLTTRQIGRSWWLATVAIPAIALAALLFWGAGTYDHFHPNTVFPSDRLVMASIFALLWLGSIFTTIFPTPGFFAKGWERACTFFFAALSLMMLFGSLLFCQDASKNPSKFAIFLGVGVLLTVVGWFRAERFVLGRASFRLAAIQYKDPRGQHRAPGGYGGIPFLINTHFVRTLLYLAAMVAMMSLLWQWQGPRHQTFESFARMGSLMSCWFVVFYQFMPALRQLRFLRTLPISATRLAAVMIAIGILPLIALGALVAGVAGLSLGTPAALTALKSYAFILAPASLCIFFAVWLGAGIQVYALLYLIIIVFPSVPMVLQFLFHYPDIPFGLTGPIAAICVLLAFLLTRRALMHSSHTYRVQANPFGNFAWGTGR